MKFINKSCSQITKLVFLDLNLVLIVADISNTFLRPHAASTRPDPDTKADDLSFLSPKSS